MNKLIIPIIVITIIAAGGDAYFILQKSAFAQPQRDKGEFIKDLDKDEDGKVCREEFPGPDDVFKRFDRDGDGFISSEEAPRGKPRSEGTVEKPYSQPKTALPQPSVGKKCGDGVCDEFEKKNPTLCLKDCQQATPTPTPTTTPIPIPAPTPTIVPSDANSLDADGFLWGTELWPDKADIAVNVINNALKTKYLKIRLSIANVARDKKTFSNIACFPSAQNCRGSQYDLDDIAQTFKSNGWSMIPMLSYGYHGTEEPFSSSDLENYANFVDWFVSRYKNDANIKYVELENCPNCNRSLSASKELLLEATNKIYDKVKGKYPDILMGTPGFEYWIDQQNAPIVAIGPEMIEYFLDKKNGAKFDFWAFHGYQLSDFQVGKGAISFSIFPIPPTRKARYNKYAGVFGISEIRKKLDDSGWQNKPIIDTESGTIFPGVPYTEEEEKIDAAYYVQASLLSRTQKVNNKLALGGKILMKINIRLNMPGIVGDVTAGDLKSDGSPYLGTKAVALLWSKLNGYKYHSHITGEFDNENQIWIEKFESENKELYIFFKPFEYNPDQRISFDNKILKYTLSLNKKPLSIILTDINGDRLTIYPAQSITLEAVNSPKYLEVEY